jgi:hypothetical protein
LRRAAASKIPHPIFSFHQQKKKTKKLVSDSERILSTKSDEQ